MTVSSGILSAAVTELVRNLRPPLTILHMLSLQSEAISGDGAHPPTEIASSPYGSAQ